MQKFRYSCDGGSLAIGTVAARFAVVNNYGDGTHSVIIYDRGERNPLDAGTEFRGAIEGKEIKVYAYDCLTDEECADENNVLVTLSGRYGVYAKINSGDILLEKWE